jgi:hypothetical protein
MTEDLFLIQGFSHIEFEAGVRFDPDEVPGVMSALI